MKQAKIVLTILILFTVVLVLWIFRSPAAFPTKQEIQTQLSKSMYQQEAKEIQDILFLDAKHAFVPFISMDNTYGGTFWNWTYKGWELGIVETKLAPKMWKLDDNRQNKHFILWNINPKDGIKKLELRLLKKRSYHITEGVHHYYTPAIHMLLEQKIKQDTYGVVKLPDEWVIVMENDNKQIPKKPLFFQPFQPTGSYIGWSSYNSKNESVFPESTVNGHGYYFFGPSLDYLMIVDENEIKSY